jgi:isopenicillin N synthase-like dioxygenase
MMAPIFHEEPSTDTAVQFIDISGYLAGSAQDKATVVSAWRIACSKQGFIALQGHGIPLSLQRDMLSSMAAFFALPLTEKTEVDISTSSCNRGYERVWGQKLEELDPDATADKKEGFSFRQDRNGGRFNQGRNVWPKRPGEFREICEKYYRALSELAITLFRITALSLDLPEKYFDELASDPDGLSNCRGHHYPPGSGNTSERGAGAHTDFGTLTILLQDGIGGLEVMHRPTQTWQKFMPVEDTFVVNLGDLMQRWTNDRYKSTMHRVISNCEGRDRYSVAFFCGMALDTIIECLPTCLEPGKKSDAQTKRASRD